LESDLSEADIYEAMKQMSGYLDITPGNFRELYRLAFRHALARLGQEVLAADIMNREVISVGPETSLAEVAEIMGRANVSGVPVVDGDRRVVGVISQRDFLKRLGAGEPNFMSLVAACLKYRGCVALPVKQQRAADLMSAPAVTVRPDTPMQEVAARFEANQINRVPVVDAGGRLVGIITRGDLVRAYRLGGSR
jgi:CBS domain-containing protein